MNYDYHIVLGAIAAFIGIVGYIPYYRDMFRGLTKPHPFTWIGFGILNSIAFFAQIAKGGGAGAWVSAITFLGCFGIAIFAFQRGEKNITGFDWTCFAGALFGIALWFFTKDPLWAVIIITVVDIIAFVPTLRKAFWKPNEETASLYIFSVLKYAISLVALNSFNLTTALFPTFVVMLNTAFIVLLLIRRRILATKTSNL